MRIQLRVVAAFLPFLALAAVPAPSPVPCLDAACRCVPAEAMGLTPTQSVRGQRERAERVVLGTVLRLDTLPRTAWGSSDDVVRLSPVVARIRVRRVWRGSRADTMTVMLTTAESRSSCDLEMRVGESYLIFASRTEGGPLATRQCAGTAVERDADETLAILGAGQSAQPSTGTLR